MDRFSSTLLAAAGEAGLATITLSRHVPSLRRNISENESVVLLSHCHGPDGSRGGDQLLLLTRGRIVVTKQSKVLNRVRTEVDAELRELDEVRWSADTTLPGVELAFTVGGVWHRYWMDTGGEKQLWRLEARLGRAFRRHRAAVAA